MKQFIALIATVFALSAFAAEPAKTEPAPKKKHCVTQECKDEAKAKKADEAKAKKAAQKAEPKKSGAPAGASAKDKKTETTSK
jgi:hypothetical protein